MSKTAEGNTAKDIRNRPFITLNLKMGLVLLLAVALAVVLYAVATAVQNYVVNYYYRSEATVEKNVESRYSDLTRDIGLMKIESSDSETLQKWLKNHRYTYIQVWDNKSIAFEGGWWLNTVKAPESQDVTADQHVVAGETNERLSPALFSQDVKNRIVSFADGDYYVYITVYPEEQFNRIMNFVKVIGAAIIIVGVLLAYTARMTRRMIKLGEEVRAVSGGDLKAVIEPTANDEIGRLAVNVDTMRNSVVTRLLSEKAAWDANTQLITAMSHDIRTPLTSLIGYLDIIESGKYGSEEEEKRYIRSCREKAFQLRDLSDKLFQYFLVFGSSGKEKKLEVYDAGILLQQIISEHAAELMSYGYQIDFEYTIPENVDIAADVSGLRRLFDNVFSNIMKYADRRRHINISAVVQEKLIIVRIINGVLEMSRKVESNNIGLKTCEKICRDMNGTFEYHDDGLLFKVRMTIPVYGGKPEEPAAGGLDEIDISRLDEVLGLADGQKEKEPDDAGSSEAIDGAQEFEDAEAAAIASSIPLTS